MLKPEFSSGNDRPGTSSSSYHAPPLHTPIANQGGRPVSPKRPGSSLRPGSRGGTKRGDVTSAEAATAAAAALLQEHDNQKLSSNSADVNEDNKNVIADGAPQEIIDNRAGISMVSSLNEAERPSDTHTGDEHNERVSQGSSSSHSTSGEANDGNSVTNPRILSDVVGKGKVGVTNANESGLLRRAATIMAEDNDIDTKVNSSFPGNHSAMPVSETIGVASNAISRLTLEERPRFSVIDGVVEEFVQGFVELERRLHLSRAQTDRDFLARLAEAQTRLLVEGDLGFSSGDHTTQGSVHKDNPEASKETDHNKNPYAAQMQFERDERLVTQLELHHGEISELMWSALATKGEVQRRGARELMDHAVTELRSCLERQEEEFKKHSAWLKATCDRKIAAARAAGDTAHMQVSGKT